MKSKNYFGINCGKNQCSNVCDRQVIFRVKMMVSLLVISQITGVRAGAVAVNGG